MPYAFMLMHAFMLTQEACDLERAAHAWFAFASKSSKALFCY